MQLGARSRSHVLLPTQSNNVRRLVSTDSGASGGYPSEALGTCLSWRSFQPAQSLFPLQCLHHHIYSARASHGNDRSGACERDQGWPADRRVHAPVRLGQLPLLEKTAAILYRQGQGARNKPRSSQAHSAGDRCISSGTALALRLPTGKGSP
jgi:hypothetical protein